MSKSTYQECDKKQPAEHGNISRARQKQPAEQGNKTRTHKICESEQRRALEERAVLLG